MTSAGADFAPFRVKSSTNESEMNFSFLYPQLAAFLPSPLPELKRATHVKQENQLASAPAGAATFTFLPSFLPSSFHLGSRVWDLDLELQLQG